MHFECLIYAVGDQYVNQAVCSLLSGFPDFDLHYVQELYANQYFRNVTCSFKLFKLRSTKFCLSLLSYHVTVQRAHARKLKTSHILYRRVFE